MAAVLPLSAQNVERTDSLVRLMSAQSMEMVQEENHNYRMVYGPARFLHNDTYLICDTAKWDVDMRVIRAWGNVQILQEETVLNSDKLDYIIDDDVAQFRGSVVQLKDKDGNTLRTRHLDYNTKDSVAIFANGASMKDKDGEIIESIDGSYDSKIKQFEFTRDVNMFSDSVFVRTEHLIYLSDQDKAEFDRGVDMWKDDKMLSSDRGHYLKNEDLFFFRYNVHMQSSIQEGWADSLYFYRNTNNILLRGNAQAKDTTRNVAALADHIFYCDSLSEITLKQNAALVAITQEQEKVDTVYIGAKLFVCRNIPMCDVPEVEKLQASKRLEDLNVDPVSEYRRKAAQDAAAAAKSAADEAKEAASAPIVTERPRKDVAKPGARRERAGKNRRMSVGDLPDSLQLSMADTLASVPADTASVGRPAIADIVQPADSVPAAATDTLSAISAVADSSMAAQVVPADSSLATADSIPSAPDSTMVGFVTALGDVKLYRSDIQMKCDSLLYNDLDSLVRLYKEPVIWNDGNRQYTADSIAVILHNSKLERASLMSNAFVSVMEDSLLFDQVKSSEIMAYFDTTGTLSRFDALGGASAIFYLEEDGVLATVNHVEARMLSAHLAGGSLDRIYYFDSPKNNAYPTVQLPADLKRMKGFSWQPDAQPKGREDITPLELKATQRRFYERKPKTSFNQTDIYFPGYIDGIYSGMAERDSIKAAHRREAALKAHLDSLHTADSLRAADSLAVKDTIAVSDSVAVKDSVAVSPAAQDSLSVAKENSPSAADLKEQARKERAAAREAKWAELDARDAEKAAAKEQKLLAKKRAKTLKFLKAQEKEAAKDQKKLDRYKARYEKQKARRKEQ